MQDRSSSSSSSLVATLGEEVFDLLQTDQLLHQALQRILALGLGLLRLLQRLRQCSNGGLSNRRQHSAGGRLLLLLLLLGQQLSLKLLRLVVSDRDQFRGFHPHGGRCGGRGRGVTQLYVLLRTMVTGQGGRMTGCQRVYADVRQPAGRATGRGQVRAGEVGVLAPLGSHVLGPAPPSPPGRGARGLLASLAHRRALLVLLLLTGILIPLYTRRCAALTALHTLEQVRETGDTLQFRVRPACILLGNSRDTGTVTT